MTKKPVLQEPRKFFLIPLTITLHPLGERGKRKELVANGIIGWEKGNGGQCPAIFL
jgi:hypothetical protein